MFVFHESFIMSMSRFHTTFKALEKLVRAKGANNTKI